MPVVNIKNGLEIAYDEFGDSSAPPMLLVMGLGTQMIAWPDPFCEGLAGHGFRVIRFDNRDVGLSTKFHDAESPKMLGMWLKSKLGLRIRNAPYDLYDMAFDAVGLMDELQVPSAHVVGASMGGMIAQILGARHGERVRSLTSIMSTTGNPRLPGPTSEIRKQMFFARPKNPDRETLISHSMETLRMIGSPGYPSPDDELRSKVTRSMDRAFYPPGYVRHVAAIVAAGDRSREVSEISVPTLVVHGADDPLVPVACGKDTVARIDGARFEVIAGMGHDLPTALIPELADLIGTHARNSETKQ